MAWLKTITFLSAFLLFQIELIIAKLFLPHYGGSYLVWGACIVFFQAVLLSGYVFAHVFLRRLGVSAYLKLHLCLLFVPLVFFPLRVLHLSFDAYPLPLVLDIFARLVLTIGPVFFILSTMSLVTQGWLSASRLKEAHNPYALYAVSNLGSFAGLLSYPFVLEPYLSNTEQLQIWRGLYLLLVGLNLLSFKFVGLDSRVRGNDNPNVIPANAGIQGYSKPPHNPLMWRWLCLGAAGVVLFLSVTNIITYEVAPVPLLWVIPLAIYLLAFILNFKQNPWCPSWIIRGAGPLLGVAAMMYFVPLKHFLPVIVVIAVLCALLFLLCMFVQHQLIQSKPASREQMTLFYVMMSLGGFLGGVLTSWTIPLISNTLIEYLVGLLLAALMMGDSSLKKTGHLREVTKVLSVLLTVGAFWGWPYFVKEYHLWSFALLWVAVGVAFWGLAQSKKLLVGAFILLILATSFLESVWSHVHYLEKKRNYYGIYKIYDNASGIRVLIHGTTLHGMQFVDEAKRRIPMGYYSPLSPIGSLLISDIFQAKRVAVVGLGTGTLALYAKPDCPIDYYELDADVMKLAYKYFWYLSNAPGEVNVILGDARISLAAQDRLYDLLVIDAFSGDAIPTHLVNRDVMVEYRRKLNARGAVVFHITNRYLNLEPVLARIAESSGAYIAIKDVGDQGVNMRSIWCILTWDQDRFLKLITQENWQPLDLDPKYRCRIWTDDYSTILPIINLNELAVSLKAFKPLAR